jgi:flavin-dependent dehydrogenase
VAIVGGGPAGCATALALQREGLAKTCLICPEAESRVHLGESLPPDSRRVFQDLRVWEEFLQDGHSRCLGTCSAWGSSELGFNDFLLNRDGFGWHLERARFDAFLLANVKSRGIRVLESQVVACTTRPEGGIRLRLQGHAGASSTLDAHMVVDATGQRSTIARQVGARRGFLDRLTFVYGFLDATDSSSSLQMTMLEATDAGWWYLAPLPGQRIAVAFATDPTLVRDQALHAQDRWMAALLRTRHVASRLEGCRFLRGGLTIRVACSGLLAPVAGPSWLAVGDAAASYDPLCAQGIQRALESGLKAAKSIAKSLGAGGSTTSEYAEAVVAGFNEYRVNRNNMYKLETRWPDSPFWRRRRDRTGSLQR